MREQLAEILGLDPDAASEADIIAAVSRLQTNQQLIMAASARENKIRAKIVESGGALNREQAIQVIESQGGFDS